MAYRILAITHVASMTGRSCLSHNFDVIGVRVFSENVTKMMLALDPTIVPLLPNPVPKASTNQSGFISIYYIALMEYIMWFFPCNFASYITLSASSKAWSADWGGCVNVIAPALIVTDQ